MMQALHVSVVVTRDSELVSSELARVEVPVRDAAALAVFEERVDEWLATMPEPIPDAVVEARVAVDTRPFEAVVIVDHADRVVAQLDRIIPPTPAVVEAMATGERPFDQELV